MSIFLHDPTIWLVVSFVLFVVCAFIFGRKIIISGLDAKIAKIRNDIQTAENLRADAQKLLNNYQEKQLNALQQSQIMIANAEMQIAEMRKRADSELSDTIARKEAMLKDRIHRMEELAMEEMRRYAAELAASATKEIIIQKMDSGLAQKLSDDSISKIGEKLN